MHPSQLATILWVLAFSSLTREDWQPHTTAKHCAYRFGTKEDQNQCLLSASTILFFFCRIWATSTEQAGSDQEFYTSFPLSVKEPSINIFLVTIFNLQHFL